MSCLNFSLPRLELPRPIDARPDRTPAAVYRSVRLRHIRIAYLRLVEGWSPRWLAGRSRVSVRTIHYWVRAALDYADPEAQALRDLIAAADADAA